MSAIWGCIDISGNKLDESIGSLMKKSLKKYKIDDIREILDDNVYMGCGLQYITKESYNEKTPLNNDGFYFDADCILDNRTELINVLSLDENIPDSSILFEAWNRWGENFGTHVIGSFAFAIYDKRLKKFHLYTDHIASRCIHYCVRKGKIYFSTITDSIIDAVGNAELSRKWMNANVATDFSFCFLFEGLTPFKGIYIIPFGSGVVIDSNGRVKKKVYWNPMRNIHQRKKFDDEKCKEEFRKVFFKCVKDAIRSDGEIGILLSSGLDSTSVASVASKYLEKENKNLYSYTSVPLEEFKKSLGDKTGYFIDDESDKVLEFCEHYKNIKPDFLECRGKSIWTYLEEWVDYLEIPSKANVNNVWINEAYEEATKKGVKVVLSGSYGNYTISYGRLIDSFKRLFLQGKLFQFISQLYKYDERVGIRKKRFVIYFLRNAFKRKKNNYKVIDDDCVKKEIIESYGIKKGWIKEFHRYDGNLLNLVNYRNLLLSSNYMQLSGIINTKSGLYHGLIVRDPTIDKRMIELCLSLPFQCFAWDGLERRLVREYLKDLVPDSIRLVTDHRGRQSGDASMRLDKYGLKDGRKPWDNMSVEMKKYFKMYKVKELLNKETFDYNIDRKAKIVACNYFFNKYCK